MPSSLAEGRPMSSRLIAAESSVRVIFRVYDRRQEATGNAVDSLHESATGA